MRIEPGSEVWGTSSPLTTAASPLVTSWFGTDGYTNLALLYTFSGGTTVMTVEGSDDAITQDTTRAYASLAASPQLTTPVIVPVMHRWIRFRIVQTVGNATVTAVYVKARA